VGILISIDGVSIPTPSELNVSIQDLSKAERMASGLMVIERIATKRKLEMSWNYLSKGNLSTILTAVSPVFFEVEYIDPESNETSTGTFYAGDRKAGALDYKNGVIRYKDISFNIIER
jgi:hypothetical protein